jgi:integrase
MTIPRRKRLIVVRPRQNRGKWEVDCRAIPGWTPRRAVFDTEEAAHYYASHVLQRIGQGLLPDQSPQPLTVREYSVRRLAVWKTQLAARTVRGYEHCLTRHVLPVLGDLPVREIRRSHVKALLEAKQAELYVPRPAHRSAGSAPEAGDQGRPYAKHTIRLIRATLSTLLTDAADDGLLPENPVFGLGKKRKGVPGVLTKGDRTAKIRPLSREQRDRLLEAAEAEPRFAALFHLLVKGGLRPGEALALRPDDLDLTGRTARVERALDLRGRIKCTKTSETRSVDLTPELTVALRRHVTRVRAEALRRGWGEPAWLFPNEENRPLDEAKMRKAFKRALKRAGLPAFRVYDLRHTYASLLLATGAPLTYVSAQLGHASPDTTLRHYARWIPSKGRRWVNALDSGTRIWNQAGSAGEDASEIPDLAGAGGGTRTHDLLITNQLLCR